MNSVEFLVLKRGQSLDSFSLLIGCVQISIFQLYILLWYIFHIFQFLVIFLAPAASRWEKCWMLWCTYRARLDPEVSGLFCDIPLHITAITLVFNCSWNSIICAFTPPKYTLEIRKTVYAHFYSISFWNRIGQTRCSSLCSQFISISVESLKLQLEMARSN